MASYRDLKVWQSAMRLAEGVYELTSGFPPPELYGMTSQMRRAAVSIASNIAEGYGRETSGAYVQSLRIAHGSLREVETQLLLAEKVRLASSGDVQPILQQCDDVGRLLWGLLRAIQEKQSGSRP